MANINKARMPDIALEVNLNKSNKEKSFVTVHSQGTIISKEAFGTDDDVATIIENKVKELSNLNNIPVERIPVIVEGSGLGSQLRAELKERSVTALQKSNKAKEYYYDYYYDDYIYSPVTPYNVINFDQLEEAEAAEELNNSYTVLFAQYAEMGQRILDGNYQLEFGDERGKLSLMTELTQQFLNKLESITAEKQGSVLKEVKQQTEIIKEATNDESPKLIVKSSGVNLFKNKNDDLIWVGIFTNKYKDRDGDIITAQAHRKFVEKLDKGEVDYPTLEVWHTGVPVGTTDFIAFDERGFLIGSGTVKKEFEELIINLVKNTPDASMSHGMPVESLVYDEDGCIIEYKSVEVSFLPGEEASNPLTAFSVEKK